jgi:BolA protein
VSVKARIEEKLLAALQPESLEVVDESHLHSGHAGHRPEGETHFRVYIKAPLFAGKSRVERHRLVNAALAEELAGPVHALAVHATAPGEPARG